MLIADVSVAGCCNIAQGTCVRCVTSSIELVGLSPNNTIGTSIYQFVALVLLHVQMTSQIARVLQDVFFCHLTRMGDAAYLPISTSSFRANLEDINEAL